MNKLKDYKNKEEFEKAKLEEIEELEKLTIDELDKRREKLLKERRSYLERKRIEENLTGTAIEVRKLINIYEEKGFKGLYAEFVSKEEREEEEITEDDIPF